MIKSLLIVVTWLQAGPSIQTQTLDSTQSCRAAAQSASQMIKLQAQSNMTAPHNELTYAGDDKAGEWTLTTGVIGREVARLRCVKLDEPAR